MNDFYEDDFILESKKEDDDEDDGLLKHGLKKEKKKSKKEQLYDDWNNKRVMSGKAKGSMASFEKEHKGKERLKRLATVAALAGGTVVAAKAIKKNKDPVAYAQRKAQKQDEKNQANEIIGRANADAAAVKAKNKEIKRGAIRAGKKSGRHETRMDNLYRDRSQYEDASKTYEKTNTKPGLFHRFKGRKFNEEYFINYLFENYDEEQLSRYLVLSESKEDKEAYKAYSKRMKEVGSEPLSYKKWKAKKYEKKRKIRKGIALSAAGILAANEIRHAIKGDPNLANRIRNYKLNKFEKNSNDRNKQNQKINNDRKQARRERLTENLDGISSTQIAFYLECISANEDFNKDSYQRYCVMLEAKGLTPLDESAFEEAKKRISAYSKAAIDGIKAEKKKKEEELKKKEEEKRKKEAQKTKEEKEKLSKMSIEEKKEYLRKKKKKEEEEEEKRQDAHDLKQTFKQSFLRGSGEQLGKSAAKVATRFIVK